MKRPVVITFLIVALALVCLGIGAVIFFGFNYGFPTNNPFDRRNIPSTLEESKTVKVDTEKPLALKVTDDAGSVSVTGGEVDAVQVKVVKTAYDSTQARADEEVKTISYTIEQSGNTVTLKYELPKSMNFSNNVNTVDFIVTVPNEVSIDVNGGMGEVSVANTKGSVKVDNDFGDVTVENVEGAVSVQTSSGAVTATSIKAGGDAIDLNSDFGTITLEKANGSTITLETNSGAITLKEVRATNKLTTNAEFGDVTFENGSADSLSVDTNSGGVSLVKITIKKELKVQDEFGNIELNQALAASYDLRTNGGSITIDGAKGKLVAHSEFGSIDILNAESVTLNLSTNSGAVEFHGSLGTGPHMVKSEFGEINLTVPPDSKLDVDLSTEFGRIKSDLPITVTLTETSNSNGDQIVGSINGGGEQITVETNNGSVNLHAEQ